MKDSIFDSQKFITNSAYVGKKQLVAKDRKSGNKFVREFSVYQDKQLGVSQYVQHYLRKSEIDDDMDTDDEECEFYVGKCFTQLVDALTE